MTSLYILFLINLGIFFFSGSCVFLGQLTGFNLMNIIIKKINLSKKNILQHIQAEKKKDAKH